MPDDFFRHHILSLGNDGRLTGLGQFPTTDDDIDAAIQHMLALTKSWKTRRIMLYAHGGTVREAEAVVWAQAQQDYFLRQEIYPFFFVWHSDPLSSAINAVKDFIKDKLDDFFFESAGEPNALNILIEKAAHAVRGLTWSQMKQNALMASADKHGGAYKLAVRLHEAMGQHKNIELNLAGHSAGGVFHATLAQLIASTGRITARPALDLMGLGLPLKTVTLWAPGCTTGAFRTHYLPYIQSGTIERFTLFTLTDDLERAEATRMSDHPALAWAKYQGSILYLVANGFEDAPPDPILGMAKYVQDEVHAVLQGKHAWIVSGDARCGAQTHTLFDDDKATLKTTVALIQS